MLLVYPSFLKRNTSLPITLSFDSIDILLKVYIDIMKLIIIL